MDFVSSFCENMVRVQNRQVPLTKPLGVLRGTVLWEFRYLVWIVSGFLTLSLAEWALAGFIVNFIVSDIVFVSIPNGNVNNNPML